MGAVVIGPERFRTSDLNQAAFLLSRGFSLLNVEPSPDRRRVFCFPEEAAEEAKAFYQNATVSARAFANALRDLKALIRER